MKAKLFLFVSLLVAALVFAVQAGPTHAGVADCYAAGSGGINLRRTFLTSFSEPYLHAEYQLAIKFRRYVPQDSLIVVTAPHRVGQRGLIQATNPPYYFFWMDRKGFTLPVESQSLSRLKQLIGLGVTHLVISIP